MSQTREMSKISGDSNLGLGLSRYIDDFFWLILQADTGVKQSLGCRLWGRTESDDFEL